MDRNIKKISECNITSLVIVISDYLLQSSFKLPVHFSMIEKQKNRTV